MTVQVDKPTRLRIGIVIDSFAQPRWVRKSLENILAADVCTFELVVKVPAEKNSERGFLYKLYSRMDESVFAAAADALEPTRIDDLVGSLPVTSEDDSEKIKTLNLDVLLNFGPTELNEKFAKLARHGVWFYGFGAAPGVREVMNYDPVTISTLRRLQGEPAVEQIIYKSTSPTLSRFSVGLNNNSCYWKSAAFMARSLVDLYQGHNASAIDVGTQGSLESPTNAAMGQMFFKLSGRGAARALEKFSSFEQWVLAYRISQTEFKYLIPPVGRFWADPFPIKVDGKYFIFFEDYVSSKGRAHIAVIEVDQNGITSGPTEVLKLDCHLSYPFIFEWQGSYYMIPESGDKNVVQLYRSVSFPFEWQPEKVLLEANQPLDATLVEANGRWWMFVNIQEKGVAVNWDELHLYHADSPMGPWKPHARNPVVSDVRSARPAGRLFWSNNVLYRPSQDSSMRYGYATTISKVTSLTPTEYSETEVAKILPNWDKDVLGVHTLNTFKEITVIDCLMKMRRFRSGKLRPLPSLGTTEDLLLARSSIVS